MFGKTTLVSIIVLCFAMLGNCTTVSPCTKGGSLDPIKSINITNCDEPPCELKRNTVVTIEEKFVPDKDIESLSTSAYAISFFLRIPFSKVNGRDACEYIYDAEGNVTGCPLKAGTEYYYKREFRVLKRYPEVSGTAEWALVENGTPITCFQVESKIIH
ncbi:ecdysteroid-regulated 16 kDa protein [Diachasma alloeum]|uniref:ecdysteroid-regulated 16 kDa protein n=1 Tax=Diachasma alloeum TaxID=454923 RepID=UPI0007382463|nr:ecdysteroid-regulated 16 kDa protein [Diachasma alloeum]